MKRRDWLGAHVNGSTRLKFCNVRFPNSPASSLQLNDDKNPERKNNLGIRKADLCPFLIFIFFFPFCLYQFSF